MRRLRRKSIHGQVPRHWRGGGGRSLSALVSRCPQLLITIPWNRYRPAVEGCSTMTSQCRQWPKEAAIFDNGRAICDIFRIRSFTVTHTHISLRNFGVAGNKILIQLNKLIWAFCVCMYMYVCIVPYSLKARIVESQQPAVTRQRQVDSNRGMFSTQSVPMTAHTTEEYVMQLLSNNRTPTEKRYSLRGTCRSYIMSPVLESSQLVT
jgi:hypothetical protein